MRVVIDTNVFVAALRSRRGASFRLFQQLGTSRFRPVVSPPLCLEYEDVLRRPGMVPKHDRQDIEEFLDYFISVSIECQIHFLWRPHLRDRKDDLILEVALAGDARWIITHNVRDFDGSETLGIRAVTPADFLRMLAA